MIIPRMREKDWIFFIDADERVIKTLESEIKRAIETESRYDGFYIPRDNFMFGGRVRYGTNANDLQLRLIRKGRGKFQNLVHEHIELPGPAGMLKNHLVHETYQTLDDYFKKFNLFTSLDAEELLRRGKKPTVFDLYLKPILHFIYFYFFKLGFLDGKRGLLFQLLSAFYLYVKKAKAIEYFRRGKIT